jgi:hypothetical protein
MSSMMFLIEFGLFGVVAIGFALREVWLNSPKQIARQEAKERAAQEAAVDQGTP